MDGSYSVRVDEMKTEMIDLKTEILDIMQGQKVSYDEMTKMFGIPVQHLESYLNGEDSALELVEYHKLSKLIAFSYIKKIPDDERLKAFCDELVSRYNFTPSIISKLTGIEIAYIQMVFDSPQKLSIEMKYQIAVRISYILFVLVS